MRTRSSSGACARRTSGSTSSSSGPRTGPDTRSRSRISGRCSPAPGRCCSPTRPPPPVRVGAFGRVGARRSALPAVFLALFADGVVRPGSSVLYPTVRHGPRDGRRVALTLRRRPRSRGDAGRARRAREARRARDLLRDRPMRSRRTREIARRVVAEGHELGNHSWRHSRWQSFSSLREQVAEIERGERAIAAIAGERRAAALPRAVRREEPAVRARPRARSGSRWWRGRCTAATRAPPTRRGSPRACCAGSAPATSC